MIKRKPKSKEQIEEEREIKEKDWNFFLHIWKKRPHYSEVSGDWLGPEPLSCFFHHILKKEKYPEFRYLEENIILLTLIEHTNAEGNPERYPETSKRHKILWEKIQEVRSRNGTENLEEEQKVS